MNSSFLPQPSNGRYVFVNGGASRKINPPFRSTSWRKAGCRRSAESCLNGCRLACSFHFELRNCLFRILLRMRTTRCAPQGCKATAFGPFSQSEHCRAVTTTCSNFKPVSVCAATDDRPQEYFDLSLHGSSCTAVPKPPDREVRPCCTSAVKNLTREAFRGFALRAFVECLPQYQTALRASCEF